MVHLQLWPHRGVEAVGSVRHGRRIVDPAPPDRIGPLAPTVDAHGAVGVHRWVEANSRTVCVRCGLGPLPCDHKPGTRCAGVQPLRGAAAVFAASTAFQEALMEVQRLWRRKVAADIARLRMPPGPAGGE